MIKNYRQLLIIFTALIPYLIFTPKQANAYIDPGTGSFILQIIVGAIVGTSVAVKMYWRKLKLFFKVYILRRKKREDDSNNSEKKEEINNIEKK